VNRRRAIGLGLWLVALAPNVRAEHAAASRPAYVVSVAKPMEHRLANGLRVVLQPDRRAPRVAVHVVYRVGSADDPKGLGELAHLLEHLTYGPTRHLAAGAIFEHLERNSWNWNGTTSVDHTTYHALVPSHRIALPLWLESERMAFALEAFTETRLESDKRIVKNELWQRAHDWEMARGIFPEAHPYHPPSHDVEDEIDGIDLDHVRALYQRTYRPDNAFIVMVGDFQVAHARSLVDRYFAPIVKPEPPLLPRFRPAFTFPDGKTLTIWAPRYTEVVKAVWSLPPFDFQRAAEIEVLAEILGDEDPLTDVLRRAGVSEGFTLEVEQRLHTGFFTLSLALRRDVDPTRADRLLDAGWPRVAEILTPERVERAKDVVVRHVLRELESAESLARAHCHWLKHAGRPFSPSQAVTWIRRVSPASLARLLTAHLAPKARLSVHLRHTDQARFDRPETSLRTRTP
jgi:zinc protease